LPWAKASSITVSCYLAEFLCQPKDADKVADGLSWGTIRGQIYARLYPNNIRSMVLDGLVDYTLSPFQQAMDMSTAVTNNFQRMLDWTSTNEDSPLEGQDARAVFYKVLSQLDKTPVTIPKCVTTGQCYPTVNGNTLRVSTLTLQDEPASGFPGE
jgi:pimeloyl-ACP methyl ester carboxylesterase